MISCLYSLGLFLFFLTLIKKHGIDIKSLCLWFSWVVSLGNSFFGLVVSFESPSPDEGFSFKLDSSSFKAVGSSNWLEQRTLEKMLSGVKLSRSFVLCFFEFNVCWTRVSPPRVRIASFSFLTKASKTPRMKTYFWIWGHSCFIRTKIKIKSASEQTAG